MRKNDISIVVPTYNSANHIEQFIGSLLEALKKTNYTYEIILIDDGSNDSTWNKIISLKSVYKDILRGVRLSNNFGQHNATLCGLVVSNGTYIVTLDDDLEHNPNDIEKLINFLNKNELEIVYGISLKDSKNILRRIITKFYKWMSKKDNPNGYGSGFRVITEDLKNKIITHSNGIFYLDEIVRWYSNKKGSITVIFNKSLRGKSNYTYPLLYSLSVKILSISSTRPLRIIKRLGVTIFLFSILLAIYFIVRKFMHNVPIGYTSLMVSILFSTGIIMACLGVIGEFLGNLIALSNKKPNYSIKDQI